MTDHDKLAMDVAERVSSLLRNACNVNADTCNLIFDRLTDVLIYENDRVLIDLLLGLSNAAAASSFIALDPVTGEQCQVAKPNSLIYRRFV